MSFTESFLAETVELVEDPRLRADRADGHRPRRGPRARRPAVHPRRRRLGRSRQPRGQRLPQDLRLRGLRADRQRLRAHRPDQRRGLGHHVRRVAGRLAARRPTTPCSCSRSAAATPRRTCRPTSCGRSSWPRSAAPRSSASSAATAATRRRSPTRARSSRPLFADHITPHTEGLCAVLWHLLVTHPALASDGDQVGVASYERRLTARAAAAHLRRRRRRLHRQPLRRAGCSPTRRPSGSPSTTTSPRAASGTSSAIEDDPGSSVVRGDVEDLPDPDRGAAGATTRSSTWPRTPTSRRRSPTRPSTSTRARC